MGAISLKIVNLLKDEELPRVGPARQGPDPCAGGPRQAWQHHSFPLLGYLRRRSRPTLAPIVHWLPAAPITPRKKMALRLHWQESSKWKNCSRSWLT